MTWASCFSPLPVVKSVCLQREVQQYLLFCEPPGWALYVICQLLWTIWELLSYVFLRIRTKGLPWVSWSPLHRAEMENWNGKTSLSMTDCSQKSWSIFINTDTVDRYTFFGFIMEIWSKTTVGVIDTSDIKQVLLTRWQWLKEAALEDGQSGSVLKEDRWQIFSMLNGHGLVVDWLMRVEDRMV